MAESVLALKKKAVKLGMDKDEAKKADRKALEAFISSASDKKPSKKNVTKKSAAFVRRAKKKTTKKPERKPARKATEAPAAKKSANKSGKAKRPQNKRKAENTAGVGRLAIGTLNWSVESDDWNPRPGGPVERLFKALKKARGDVNKAFDAIHDEMYDFVGKKKRNGDKRTKAEAEQMLRYRLHRTKFEFARATGQHESATDRVEYGTGQYATAKKGRTTSRKKAAEKPARKPVSKSKTTAKRGRPKGSKNKSRSKK